MPLSGPGQDGPGPPYEIPACPSSVAEDVALVEGPGAVLARAELGGQPLPDLRVLRRHLLARLDQDIALPDEAELPALTRGAAPAPHRGAGGLGLRLHPQARRP